MKNWVVYFCCMVIYLGFSSYCYAETGTGIPLKYISSCELDFNDDEKPDIALLIETRRGWELIVLITNASGYNAIVVSRDKPNMYLSCHFGKTIKETLAGKGKDKGKAYETLGTYMQLTQPEGSSVAYFWDGKGFREVWTSD